MTLPIIEEGVTLDSFSTTNNGSRPLGHSTIYGASSEDSTSIFSHSTNSTASNIPGPGRVLGNFYSSTGRRLERTLGDLAHKAGFSPEAIYQQISTLYLEDWKTDGKKASMLQKLCLKLFKQTKSVVDSTRFRSIMRWRDILRDHHEIYVWLFCSQRERMVKDASALLRVIEELQSTTNTLSDDQDAVLCETSLLVNLHSVGLNVINLNHARLLIEGGNFQVDWTGATDIHREEIKKWDLCFQYLLKSLEDPTISELSRWYIDFLSSQIVQGNLHQQFALQLCRTLQCVVESVDPSHIDCWGTLSLLGKKVHEYFVGASDSRAKLLRVAQGDDFIPCDGVPVHISIILNDLVRSYNRVFSSGLDIVPDLTCITMLGSTDPISADAKKKIRGFLEDLQNVDKGRDKAFTEMMLLRSCNKLFKRALSELEDRNSFNELSNVKSFTDGTSRWAILQLGDIFQSLPEVYILLITLGGDEMRDSVESLRQSLQVFDNPTSTLERYPGILMNLRSLLACHAACVWLVYEDMLYAWPPETIEFIRRTAPFGDKTFREDRDHFVPYLMDNVTFNPLIVYLKYCISRICRADYLRYHKNSFLSCSILQGALLTEKSIPQENRNAMGELCKYMQNSIIEQLRSAIGYIESFYLTQLGHAMRSVYTDITESRQAFVNEAEYYLLELCNLCFEIILKTNCIACKRDMIIELSDFFGPRNVFGWFLSIRGPDVEESISRLLEDDSQISEPNDVRYHTRLFLHLEAHRLGVELLAPRHEKLRFEGTGLTKRVSTRSAEPPLTPEQKERWTNAFKILATNLSSEDLHLISISLFYFANCPLPSEFDPLLDTAIAVDYCEKLQAVFSKVFWYDVNGLSDLSRAVFHIHTYLTKRVEFVKESCKDLAPDEPPTFYGTPFDISKVLKVLNDLPKWSKTCKFRYYGIHAMLTVLFSQENCDNAPELLPTLDY